MKIFFDARWTRTTTHDGISRYGASLVAALAKQHPVTVIIHDPAQLKLLPKAIPYVLLNHPFHPSEFFIARKLNALGADVVFSPLQYMGWQGRKYKLILTLQDLIYYHHPQPPHFLPWFVRIVWRLFHLAYWPQRWILNHADHVATVSKTSKKFIHQHRLTDRDVSVIYNAPQPFMAPQKAPKKPEKSLVYMGSFMPYKNVETLLASLQYLPGYTLHLLSPIQPARRAELERLIPDGASVKFWNGISDDDYSALLRHCVALVSASREEGFGLPLVEAMAQGVPVVCSDIEIFHEVAGDAGLFFAPNDPAALARHVTSLETPKTRQLYSKKGHQQAAAFTWNNSATTLLAIMQELADS